MIILLFCKLPAQSRVPRASGKQPSPAHTTQPCRATLHRPDLQALPGFPVGANLFARGAGMEDQPRFCRLRASKLAHTAAQRLVPEIASVRFSNA